MPCMSPARWIPILALAASLAAPLDAAACGGCFHGPATVQVVTDHRMVLSLSRDQTVLWDQFRYSGRPEEFSWILPIRNGPGVVVEAAENVFLTAMDDVSAAQVNPAPSPFRCSRDSGGCGFASGASAPSLNAGFGDPSVNVYSTTVVGPYQVTTLGGADPMALRNWLTGNGYVVPPATAPIIDFYVQQRMDFVAVRLRPGAEVAQMQPLRVVMPGYVPLLPLRMIGAGIADKVGLVLTVIAESRVEAMNFPNGEVRDADLAFDYDRPSTDAAADFLAAFNRINRANGSRVWLTESAARVSASDVSNARSIRCSRGFGAPIPSECTAMSMGTPDVDLAFRPFGAAATVTRLRADLNGTALDRDLQLAASDRAERGRTYNYGTLRNDPCANPSTEFEGCSAGGRTPPGEAYLAGLGVLGLVAAARTRRRRGSAVG
jgi:MYXO-CTERM domain-containing protein